VVVNAGLTITLPPLVMLRFPGVMMHVPLVNDALRVELPPDVMVVGVAWKPEMKGAPGAVTVTVAVCVAV
jgi:hypothetical protein